MLTLKAISQLTCTQALLDLTEDTSEEKTDYIVKLLSTECFSAVTEGLLNTLVEMYPLKVTDHLLSILTGPHTRKLCLRKCEKLSSGGIAKTLCRCSNIQYLDISETNRYFTISIKMAPHLTVLHLESCAMNDSNVHSLLLNLSELQHLNISSCIGLTDKVFLVDKVTQLSRELHSQSSPQCLTPYSSRLHSVDISGCRQLSSTSVRHLMTWCGPTLRCINVACTKVDCIALLYLAGYGLQSVVKIALEADKEKSYSADTLFNQIDDLYQLNSQDKRLYDSDSSYSETDETLERSYRSNCKDRENCGSSESCDGKTRSITGMTVNDCDIHLNSEQNDCVKDDGSGLDVSHLTCVGDFNTKKMFSEKCDEKDSIISIEGLCQPIHSSSDSRPLHNCKFCNDLKKHIQECNTLPFLDESVANDVCKENELTSKTTGVCDTCETSESSSQCKTSVSDSISYCFCDNDLPDHISNCTENICVGKNELLSSVIPTSGCELLQSSDSENTSAQHSSHLGKSRNCKEGVHLPHTPETPNGCTDFTEYSANLVKIIEPNIISLDIIDASYHSSNLGNECLRKFIIANQNLQKFSMSWKELDDSMLMYIADHASSLRELVLEDCSSLTALGVRNLSKICQNLTKIELKGVCFIGDEAIIPLLQLENLKCLNLAEVAITDLTLEKIKEFCSSTLEELDLSWCEEITSKGLNTLATCLPYIRHLSLRHCPADNVTLGLLSENCRNLTKLILPSVGSIKDDSVILLAEHLPELEEIDISWNSDLTDACVAALLRNGSKIKEAYFTGVKLLTSSPFLPLISDLSRWRKCQALLRFKYHERKVLRDYDEDTYSSDEEYDSLFLPHRSTSYAPNMKILELSYCDRLNDHHLAEIVAVCRGSLQIWDYYCELVKPAYVKSQVGKGYLAPR